MSRSQFKLKKWLSKMEPVVVPQKEPLLLSEEMTQFLDSTLSDENDEGLLPETVSSVLARPLDAISVYCPTAAILQSTHSASRMPSSSTLNMDTRNDFDMTTESNLNNNFLPTLSTPSRKFRDTVSSLNVLWLKRRAAFEKEEGEYSKAVATLGEAVDLFVGTKEYEKADLRAYKEDIEPAELVEHIEATSFLYDVTAHISAGRIQRFLRRYHIKRLKAATLITKSVKGFLKRLIWWRRKDLRKQCATLIQRRYKIHYRYLCLMATKIKRWYQMRMTMHRYGQVRRRHRAAKFIQRVWRGYQGRKEAARRRRFVEMVMKVQRNYRGYVCRRTRCFGLSLYHQYFFYAARSIQSLVRRVQSTGKVQRKLIHELTVEDERMERESAVIRRVIKREVQRAKYYMSTSSGRMHRSFVHQQLQLKDARLSLKLKTASESELESDPTVDVYELQTIVCFEILDTDGDRKLSLHDLQTGLQSLMVMLTEKKTRKLAAEITSEYMEGISYRDFARWYQDDDSDDLLDKNAISLKIKEKIKNRLEFLESKGQLVELRTDREMVKTCCQRAATAAMIAYRQEHPPKYQCCQCLQAFVLFSEYFAHFTGAGHCGVTNRAALFFKDFWLGDQWIKQRQCEYEVMRYNEENAVLAYETTKAWFVNLAALGTSPLSGLVRRQIEASKAVLKDGGSGALLQLQSSNTAAIADGADQTVPEGDVSVVAAGGVGANMVADDEGSELNALKESKSKSKSKKSKSKKVEVVDESDDATDNPTGDDGKKKKSKESKKSKSSKSSSKKKRAKSSDDDDDGDSGDDGDDGDDGDRDDGKQNARSKKAASSASSKKSKKAKPSLMGSDSDSEASKKGSSPSKKSKSTSKSKGKAIDGDEDSDEESRASGKEKSSKRSKSKSKSKSKSRDTGLSDTDDNAEDDGEEEDLEASENDGKGKSKKKKSSKRRSSKKGKSSKSKKNKNKLALDEAIAGDAQPPAGPTASEVATQRLHTYNHHVIDVCASDSSLTYLLAHLLCVKLGTSLPDHWASEDRLEGRHLRDWLFGLINKRHRGSKDKNPIASETDANAAAGDNSGTLPAVPAAPVATTNTADAAVTSGADAKAAVRATFLPTEESESLLDPLFLAIVKQKLMLALPRIYVHSLRLVHAALTEKILALAAYRLSYPRLTDLDDDLLLSKGLEAVTSTSYIVTHALLAKQISTVQERIDMLMMLQKSGFIPLTIRTEARIDPGASLTKEAMREKRLRNEHMRAEALTRKWLGQSLGRKKTFSLATALKKSYRGFTVANAPSKQDPFNKGEFRYLFHRLTVAPSENEAESDADVEAEMLRRIDRDDFAVVQNALALSIKPDAVNTVMESLDMLGTGSVGRQDLEQWLLSGHDAPYKSTLRRMWNSLAYAAHVSTFTLFTYHARTVLILNERRRARTKMQALEACLQYSDDADLEGLDRLLTGDESVIPELVRTHEDAENMELELANRPSWRPNITAGARKLATAAYRGIRSLVFKPEIVPDHELAASDPAAYARMIKFQDFLKRVQDTAVKQVYQYIRTPQGGLLLQSEKMRVKTLWKKYFSLKVPSTIPALIGYVSELMSDEGGVLVTELSNIMVLLIRSYGLQPDQSKMHETMKSLNDIRGKHHIYRLSTEDAINTLQDIFLPLKGLRHKPAVRLVAGANPGSRRQHSILAMVSRARQQAVVIALRFEFNDDSETRYRCAVLGLHAVVRQVASGVKEGVPGMQFQQHQRVPKEALPLLLLVEGFSAKQVAGEKLQAVTRMGEGGVLGWRRVSVDEILHAAYDAEGDIFSIVPMALRGIYRKLSPLSYGSELIHLLNAMSLYKEEIDRIGEELLQEIRTGLPTPIQED